MDLEETNTDYAKLFAWIKCDVSVLNLLLMIIGLLLRLLKKMSDTLLS